MLVLLCCVQLITAVERQVFDFLGYQWAAIMVNFFHIIAVILELFGAIQYRWLSHHDKRILSQAVFPGHPLAVRRLLHYLLWMFVWIGWNVFVSCLYLDLGGFLEDSHILSLGGSSHFSWWKNNEPGCQSQNL